VSKCKICGKETSCKSYCVLHEKAYQNLVEKFEEWKKALELSWKDYLNEIIKNPFAGTKAKEVAATLLQEQKNRPLKV